MRDKHWDYKRLFIFTGKISERRNCDNWLVHRIQSTILIYFGRTDALQKCNHETNCETNANYPPLHSSIHSMKQWISREIRKRFPNVPTHPHIRISTDIKRIDGSFTHRAELLKHQTLSATKPHGTGHSLHWNASLDTHLDLSTRVDWSSYKTTNGTGETTLKRPTFVTEKYLITPPHLRECKNIRSKQWLSTSKGEQ